MPSGVFVSNLPAVLAAMEVAENKAIRAACNVGRNQVLKNMEGARSGVQYRVPGTSVYYTASAPGEYPAVRLGDLKGSVRYEVKGNEGKIGTDKEHGLALEKKPPDKGGREWLRPSLEEARPDMLDEFQKRWF